MLLLTSLTKFNTIAVNERVGDVRIWGKNCEMKGVRRRWYLRRYRILVPLFGSKKNWRENSGFSFSLFRQKQTRGCRRKEELKWPWSTNYDVVLEIKEKITALARYREKNKRYLLRLVVLILVFFFLIFVKWFCFILMAVAKNIWKVYCMSIYLTILY